MVFFERVGVWWGWVWVLIESVRVYVDAFGLIVIWLVSGWCYELIWIEG